jgi:hypothetical protein
MIRIALAQVGRCQSAGNKPGGAVDREWRRAVGIAVRPSDRQPSPTAAVCETSFIAASESIPAPTRTAASGSSAPASGGDEGSSATDIRGIVAVLLTDRRTAWRLCRSRGRSAGCSWRKSCREQLPTRRIVKSRTQRQRRKQPTVTARHKHSFKKGLSRANDRPAPRVDEPPTNQARPNTTISTRSA